MGYDNIEMLKFISPRLCSVEYDVDVLGENLFEELLDQMQSPNKKIVNRILAYRIIQGESI